MSLRNMSLILMKDMGRTVKVRLSSSSLVFLLFIILLFPACLALSVWLNFHLYSERNILAHAKVDLQKQLDRDAQTITRLGNLEQFLKNNSSNLLNKVIAQSNQDLLDIPVVGDSAKLTDLHADFNEIRIKNTDEVEKLFLAENNGLSISLAIGGEATVDTSIKTTSVNSNTEADLFEIKVEENTLEAVPLLSLETEENNLTETEPETDLKLIVTAELSDNSIDESMHKKNEPEKIPDIDLALVNLGKISIKKVSYNMLSIKYLLENSGKRDVLVGTQNYTHISKKTGKRTAITQVSNADFRIKAWKNVNSRANISSINVENGDLIEFEIREDDEIIYRKSHPVT